MNFLVTNDDGIHASGIGALSKVAADFGESVVVAPDRQHSGSGHRITENLSISMDEVDVRRYAISGTPADCTRIGLAYLDSEADWVLSGINAGGNLGCDVFMSGTVAAVREAALMGWKGIAFSQYRHGISREFLWERAMRWTRLVLEKLLQESLQTGEFWNVNLPDPEEFDVDPEIIFCPVDVQHYQFEFDDHPDGVRYKSHYQGRPRTPGRDIDVCFGGNIAVSKLTVCSNAPGTTQ